MRTLPQTFTKLEHAIEDAKDHSMFRTQYVKKVKALGTYVVDESPVLDVDVLPVCSVYENIKTTYPSLESFEWIRLGYLFNHSFSMRKRRGLPWMQ